MRQQTARAGFGFVKPAPSPHERRFVRNAYAQVEYAATRRANAAERAAYKGASA